MWNHTGKPVADTAGTAVMHMVDSVVGFGLPSAAWNMRDSYRNEYSEPQRIGAQIGDTVGVLLPAAYAVSWARSGAPVGHVKGNGMWIGRAIIGTMLIGGTAASGAKLIGHVRDEGNVMVPAAVAGLATGLVLGKRLTGSRVAALGGGLGLAATAGVAGHVADLGPGHIGEHHPDPAPSSAAAPLRFLRNGWMHFVEDGPPTQGVIAGAERWDRRGHVQDDYDNVELAGALTGDAVALGLAGTGAAIMGGQLLGWRLPKLTHHPIGKAAVITSLPARMVNDLLNIGEVDSVLDARTTRKTRSVGRRALKDGSPGTPFHRSVINLITGETKLPINLTTRRMQVFAWGAAASALGYTAYQAWSRGHYSPDSVLDGQASAAVSVGLAIGGAGLAWRRSPLMRSLPMEARVPAAFILSAGVASMVGVVRSPGETIIADVREAAERISGRAR